MKDKDIGADREYMKRGHWCCRTVYRRERYDEDKGRSRYRHGMVWVGRYMKLFGVQRRRTEEGRRSMYMRAGGVHRLRWKVQAQGTVHMPTETLVTGQARSGHDELVHTLFIMFLVTFPGERPTMRLDLDEYLAYDNLGSNVKGGLVSSSDKSYVIEFSCTCSVNF